MESLESENPYMFELICSKLKEKLVEFQVIEVNIYKHAEAVKTSEEAAKARNSPLESGAKAMIIKYYISKTDFKVIIKLSLH